VPPVSINDDAASSHDTAAGATTAAPHLNDGVSGTENGRMTADTPNQMVQDYVELASHIMLHPLNSIQQAAARAGATKDTGIVADDSLPTSTGASSSNPAMIPQSQYLVHLSALGYLKSAVRRPQVMERWSPYEIALFEAAIAEYGKEFAKIQREIGPTKTVAEVIEFYYLWKKTTHYPRWKQEYIPEHLDVHDDD
jgi:Myb-like DNA-binding domain